MADSRAAKEPALVKTVIMKLMREVRKRSLSGHSSERVLDDVREELELDQQLLELTELDSGHAAATSNNWFSESGAVAL